MCGGRRCRQEKKKKDSNRCDTRDRQDVLTHISHQGSIEEYVISSHGVFLFIYIILYTTILL